MVSVAQKTGGQRGERTERGGKEEREMEIREKEQRKEGNLLQVNKECALSTYGLSTGTWTYIWKCMYFILSLCSPVKILYLHV